MEPSLCIVNDGLIASVTLYSPRLWIVRFDVLPFAIAYGVLFCMTMGNNLFWLQMACIGLPITLILHLLMFMLSQWSLDIKCFVGYIKVSECARASFVHVTPAANAGNAKVVPLHRTLFSTAHISVLGNDYSIPEEYFEFQKVVYGFDMNSNTFRRIQYPTSGTISTFLSSKGYSDDAAIDTALSKWRRNEFDIPLPNFLDMYLGHLIAPFFVFQILCLFLWSLDDYWYYSVFTLLMLMFFEGMMCKQRQASLAMLRNMRRPPVLLFVYRAGVWRVLSSDLLVPGDLFSASSVPLETVTTAARGGGRSPGSGREAVLPCDAVLVRGSGVVNEAMLTGESVPQIKETLRSAAADSALGENSVLDLGADSAVDAQWRRHVLFSGTALLQHCELTDADDGGNSTALCGGVSSAPDRGCLAVVVRTGFGTCQGGLMRKILFATERVSGGGDSMETVCFIGVLVVCAVIAAGGVLLRGLQDERRNKFRLVLHCVMIVTSVVPPELPMELSLAVTNSLAALSKSLVYCTEPFRISLAGKLDVLCFDKTGTLTKDEMILRGVVAPQDGQIVSANRTMGGAHSSTDTANLGPSAGSSSSSSSSGGKSKLGGPQLEERGIDDGDEADCEFAATTTAAAVTEVLEASSSFDVVAVVMGACHDLLPQASNPQDKVINLATGEDPLEQAAMRASGFLFAPRPSQSARLVVVNAERKLSVSILHKYPFSSALKRMSSLVSVETDVVLPSPPLLLLCKGAPEVIEDLLEKVPSFYRSTYRYHMSRGRRVLAMAYKQLSNNNKTKISFLRTQAESSLHFAGFLVFDSDLKSDSRSVIRELRAASHRVVMITGDSVFTAVDVARKVGMLAVTPKEEGATANVKVLHLAENDGGDIQPTVRLTWRRIGEEQQQDGDIPYSESTLQDVASTASLCVTGGVLSALEQQLSAPAFSNFLVTISPAIAVFARVSPAQKESVVLALNGSGLHTLMCGDGTNDVGALKAAHVGISIVNNPQFESRVDSAVDATETSSTVGGKKAKGAAAKGRMARALRELQEQESDPTVVKLGDASIASPFTARRTSIDSVLTVVRQGRCTLVTTIQVYKILALNCLVSAFMMSALYMRGLKQGDTQMTASGLIVAGLFFFLSQAKPLQRVSAIKPPSTVFSRGVALSIMGQFAVHLCSLLAVLQLCHKHVLSDDFSLAPDGKFQPNIVNSAMFLLSALMQINNFVVNYRGHPFTQSISENVMLWRSVQVLYGVLLVVAGGQLEPLNDLLQMAPFPSSEFQAILVGILGFNFIAAYAVEKFCQSL